MVLVICGTVVKNRWGINLDPVSCPRCNTPLPQIRRPQKHSGKRCGAEAHVLRAVPRSTNGVER